MRRQSKPFVTEYKSSSRRSKDAFGQDPQGDIDLSRLAAGADDGYDAAMRAADALFSPKRAEATQAAAPTTTAAPPAEATEAARAAPIPERPAGRILQAIEEAPADPFAELEALHAPKRRGRKPGSKNKPKAAAIERPAPMVDAPRPAIPAVAVMAAVVAARPSEATEGESTGATPRGERFGWVRTKLRPGERWKRRIPKVAW